MNGTTQTYIIYLFDGIQQSNNAQFNINSESFKSHILNTFLVISKETDILKI